MGILRYIPKVKEVIDNRSSEGGFYEAECDECNNPFYPKRSNAKYCSRSCLVMAYRKLRLSGTPKKNKTVKSVTKSIDSAKKTKVFEGTGSELAYELKGKYSMQTENKPIYKIKPELYAMPYGSTITYGSLIVGRRSERRFMLFTTD